MSTNPQDIEPSKRRFHWICTDCDFAGSESNGNPERDWCSHCADDFPASADLCPGCGQDSLTSACPKCAGSYSECEIEDAND